MNVDLNERVSQIRACLSEVCDPELDEPVTDLGFVDGISADITGNVKVTFHLPTFWCGANFAYLMASDIRSAVSALQWVTSLKVELEEHFCSEEINSGVEQQRAFKQIFANDAEDDLDSLRLLFSRKSFQRRQELLLQSQLLRFPNSESLIGLSLRELQQLSLNDAEDRLRDRYLKARRKLGFFQEDTAAAFHSVDGAPLDSAGLNTYLAVLRTVRINTELNGALCRGLLEARYGGKSEDSLVVIAPAEP